MSDRKRETDIPEAVNRYRFWGFPTGVSMLPRFAATVMSAATRSARPSMPAARSVTRARGTNVMSATSFVTTILAKKTIPTSANAIARWDFARETLPHRIEDAERAKPGNDRHKAKEQRERVPVDIGRVRRVGRNGNARRGGEHDSDNEDDLAPHEIAKALH